MQNLDSGVLLQAHVQQNWAQQNSIQQTHHRMDLNNYLLSNGGTDRLTFATSQAAGRPDISPWYAIAYIDKKEYGRGTGTTLAAAKEEASRQVLRTIYGDRVKNRVGSTSTDR